MGGRATWLVVAAVIALGAAAVVDALRGHAGADGPSAARPATTAGEAAPARPAVAGTTGVLYYTNAQCRLRAVQLPSGEETEAPEWDDCAFSLSPGASEVLPADVVWQPPAGDLRALGELGFVYLVGHGPGPEQRLPGSAPAFTPNGTFTFARRGRVYELAPDCPPGRSGAAELERTFLCPRVIARLPDGAITKLVWLSQDRFAAIIERPDGEDELVIAEPASVIVRVPGWGEPISSLRASPGGAYVSVLAPGRGGLLVFDRDGNAVALPNLTGARAITWSPGEEWAAVATGASVFLFRPGTADARPQRLPIAANDLAWRANKTALPADLSGVLVYTDEACRMHALVLPENLAAPPPTSGSCRFSTFADGEVLAEGAAFEDGVAAKAVGGDIRVDAPNRSFRFRGSAPAFRPDGRLTYARGGDVWALDVRCPRVSEPGYVEPSLIRRCSELAIGRKTLRRAAAEHPNVPEARRFLRSVRVKQLAWLDSARAVAVLVLRIKFVGRYELIALFEEGGGTVYVTFAIFGGQVVDLQTSAHGRYLGVRSETTGEVLILDRDGRSVNVPSFTEPRAFAFSPDERWLAVASRASLYFLRTDRRNPRLYDLGIEAADVGWIAE